MGKLPLRACPGAGTAPLPLTGPLEAAARLGGSSTHRTLRPQSPGPERPGLRRPPPAPGLCPEGCRSGPRAPRYHWAGRTHVGGRTSVREAGGQRAPPQPGVKDGTGHPALLLLSSRPRPVSGLVTQWAPRWHRAAASPAWLGSGTYHLGLMTGWGREGPGVPCGLSGVERSSRCRSRPRMGSGRRGLDLGSPGPGSGPAWSAEVTWRAPAWNLVAGVGVAGGW